MKKVLMMLCTLFFLASCKQESAEPHAPTSQKESIVRLSVSAQPDDITSAEKNSAREAGTLVNFYINGENKIQAVIKDRDEVEVFTFVYNGATLLYEGILKWKVKPDGKTLYYEGDISLKRAVNTSEETKIVALLGYGMHDPRSIGSGKVQVNTNQAGEGVTPITRDRTDPRTGVPNDVLKNVPFVLTNRLDMVGNFLTNKPRSTGEKKFKPRGVLLRIILENKTTKQIPVGAIWIREQKYDVNQYWVFDSSTGNIENYNPSGGRDNVTSDLLRISLRGRRELIPWLEPNSSNVEILYWCPQLDTHKAFELLYWKMPLSDEQPIAPLRFLYTPYTRANDLGSYADGKIYTLRLKIQDQVNPLSLFSEYPVATNGTSFATTHDPNDPSYGLFTYDEAKNLRIGEYNRLPTQAEWNTILPTDLDPTTLNSYESNDIPAFGDFVLHESSSYFRWAWLPPSTYSPDNSFWITGIRFIRHLGIYRGNGAFAFRYHWTGDEQGKYRLTIQCKPFTDGISDEPGGLDNALDILKRQPHTYWADAVVRHFPSVNIYNNATLKEGAIYWGGSNGMGYKSSDTHKTIDVPIGQATHAWITPKRLGVSPDRVPAPSATKYPVYLYKGGAF